MPAKSKSINVALIGQKFMGRAHSNAYLKAPRFFDLPLNPVMHTIIARDLPSLQAFADRSRLFVVRHRGAPVAAAFVIGYRGRLEIPWASSLREANSIGVNMLLYWNVLEYACRERYAMFDFGRSTVDAGTFKFKKQWGAQPHQLYWHYWIRGGGQPPVINPSNPKYRLAVAAWQRLPLPVANRLGPWLVRNLP